MKRLVGRTDIEDALMRLDRLTQEEARMAVAQNLMATHTVDERVRKVANTVVAIDNRVASVDERVARVDDGVTGVNDKVKGIDARLASIDDRVKMVVDKVIHGAQIIFSQSPDDSH
jgi:archaellum component FlaC